MNTGGKMSLSVNKNGNMSFFANKTGKLSFSIAKSGKLSDQKWESVIFSYKSRKISHNKKMEYYVGKGMRISTNLYFVPLGEKVSQNKVLIYSE